MSGADVIGTASPSNFDDVRSLGAVPVAHRADLVDRIRAVAPRGVDAYLDNFADGNVEVALALGVHPRRVNTIVDGRAAAMCGVQTRAQQETDTPAIWAEIAGLARSGPNERLRPLIESTCGL